MVHLKFKGKDMNCSVSQMKYHLLTEGFEEYYEFEGTCCLKGTFAGIRNAKVIVCPRTYSTTIKNIMVKFPETSSWSDLRAQYLKVKDSMTRKYGSPMSSDETSYELKSHYVDGNNVITLCTSDSELLILYSDNLEDDTYDSFDSFDDDDL